MKEEGIQLETLVTDVNAVLINFECKMAVVSFDDVMTNVSVPMHATADVGYPSSVMSSGESHE